MIEPDWDLYRAFLAVLDEGSLSGAARALAQTQPTLGRKIAQLEARLGLSLFLRTPQGLRPTDAAHELAAHARIMAASAGALMRAASGGAGAEAGVVRITASDIVSVEVLPPILAAFRKDHPAIDIELASSNRPQDLLHGEADVAVRMFRPAQEALIVQAVGVIHAGLYAHKDYLRDRPASRSLEDLRGELVGFDIEPPFAREVIRQFGVSRDDFCFRSDNDLAQLAAVRAGIGFGFIQHGVARRDPALVPLMSEISLPLPMWVTMHEDLRASRRVRLVFDALVAGLSDYVKASQD